MGPRSCTLAAKSRRTFAAQGSEASFSPTGLTAPPGPGWFALWVKPGGISVWAAKEPQQRIPRPSRPAWITRVRRLRPGPSEPGGPPWRASPSRSRAPKLRKHKMPRRLCGEGDQRPQGGQGRPGWRPCRCARDQLAVIPPCQREQRGRGPYPMAPRRLAARDAKDLAERGRDILAGSLSDPEKRWLAEEVIQPRGHAESPGEAKGFTPASRWSIGGVHRHRATVGQRYMANGHCRAERSRRSRQGIGP